MTTSHYEVYGTLPTMTEAQKASVLAPEYVLPAATATELGGVKQAANIADSSATTVAGVKEALNSLLAALKAAGIMVADSTEE